MRWKVNSEMVILSNLELLLSKIAQQKNVNLVNGRKVTCIIGITPQVTCIKIKEAKWWKRKARKY